MAGRAIGACRSVAKRFLSVIPLGPISRRNYGYVVSHVHRQPDSFVFFFIPNFSIYQPYIYIIVTFQSSIVSSLYEFVIVSLEVP